MRLPRRGRGQPSAGGPSTRKEWDGYGYPLTGDGHGGPLGTLHSPPESERGWGCRNADTGETVRMKDKTGDASGDILIAEDGSKWRVVRGGVRMFEAAPE
jgi:hypothetical protein